MGSLLLNTESLSNNYENIVTFVIENEQWFDLIIYVSQKGYTIYKDFVFDGFEIVKGLSYNYLVSKLYSEPGLDMELKRKCLISFQKLSSDDIFSNYDEMELTYKTETYNHDTAIGLAFLNKINLFSNSLNENFKNMCINVEYNYRPFTILNVVDIETFNNVKLLDEEQTFKEYIENHDVCIVSNNSKLESFAGLSSSNKLDLINKLGNDLYQIVNPQQEISCKRIRPLHNIIPSGWELKYRMENTAYRIYYFIEHGKVAILLDSIKKSQEISPQVISNIQRIYQTY